MLENTLLPLQARPKLLLAAKVFACFILVAVCAQVALPLPWTPVPITLQVLGVLLTGVLLSPGAAASALMLYVLAGAAGFPVFAPTGPGGMLALSGPTGGYLLSYPLAAALTSWLYQRFRARGHHLAAAVGGLAGISVIYFFGLTWLQLVLNQPLSMALAAAVYPFIVPDVLKLVVVAFVSKPLSR